jgi:hypothetical protein
MNSADEKPRNSKYLIYGALFLLLGVAAVIVAPNNYFLYANFLLGLGYVAAYFFYD